MPIATKEALFLGNYADADTNEVTVIAENPDVYLGSFGSSGAPLSANSVLIDFDDVNADANIVTDNMGMSPEPISYDLGSGPTSTFVDSLAVVDMTVTYTDGSTASFSNVVMFQDATGNLFLANSDFAGTDLNASSWIESINVTSADTSFNGLMHQNMQAFACYLAKTRIRTKDGDIPVEHLNVGDLVLTQDNGLQPIRWIASETVPRSINLYPVRISGQALGAGLPVRDLLVSQQHRMIVRSRIIGRVANMPEAYVKAKKLTDFPGIELDPLSGPLVYFHLMCDRHEIIFAEGAPSETLFPGKQALNMIGPRAGQDLLSKFPTLHGNRSTAGMARKELKGIELREVIYRHQKNAKPLLSEYPPSGP